MVELQYADPIATKAPLPFDVLPPVQQVTQMANPPAVRQPLDIRQTTGGALSRPIQYHAQPHTIPSVQQQIKNDAANWRTIDITPNRPRVNTTQSVIAGTSVVSNNNFAQEQAFEQAAYLFGWSLAGLWDGAVERKNYPIPLADFSEKGAYDIGNMVGRELRDLSQQAKDNFEDLWKNRPQFEIPQIRIPSIDRPGIPEFKIPDLPEFKIPEFKFDEPQDKDKPIPQVDVIPPKILTDKERIIRELDITNCGSISFRITYVSKVVGDRNVPDGNGSFYTERITEPSTLDHVYGLYRAWWLTQDIDYGNYVNAGEWVESGGGTGSINNVDLGGGIKYKAYIGIGNGAAIDGSNNINNYPFYYASQTTIEVTGLKSKESLNILLDSLANNDRKPEIYRLDLSKIGATDCPVGKSPPQRPPDLEDTCDCMAQCCPDIDYRKIKAFIDDAVSKLEVVASLPISWQIRNEGNRPQMVIQCGEENGVDADGNKKYKSAMYPISVPHWDGTPSDKITLPSYIKGNYEGIYTLSDNSKVTINAQNELQCKRILNAIIPHISKAYLKDAYFKGGNIVRETPIKESRVKPRYGRYFKNGQKNNKPDWRVDFT